MNAYDHAVNLICNPGDTVILPNPCYKLFKGYNNSIKIKTMSYEINPKTLKGDVN